MSVTEEIKQKIWENYRRLPLMFVPNVGQTHENVHYYVTGSGRGIYFTQEEVVLTFVEKPFNERRDTRKPQERNETDPKEERAVRGMVLALRFLGANPNVKPEGQEEGGGKVNYFIGNDPEKWYTNLSIYNKVVYRELWPGINLAFHEENGKLKYEFAVQPGAQIENIRLMYRGADDLTVDESGSLQIHTPYGILTDKRPVSYQEIGGRQVSVMSSFVVETDENEEKSVGFSVGNDYDRRYPLFIDPGLVYSTYLGGSNTDVGFGIAVDSSGSAYVTGETLSTNFPTQNPFQGVFAGEGDAFVAKLSPTGNTLLYSTYFGGSNRDVGRGIAVDSSGSAYVTGAFREPLPAAFSMPLWRS
jgi:hypothetical protein